jgi:hypothetical protein
VGTRSPSTDWRFLRDGREIAIPASGRLQANNANACSPPRLSKLRLPAWVWLSVRSC